MVCDLLDKNNRKRHIVWSDFKPPILFLTKKVKIINRSIKQISKVTPSEWTDLSRSSVTPTFWVVRSEHTDREPQLTVTPERRRGGTERRRYQIRPKKCTVRVRCKVVSENFGSEPVVYYRECVENVPVSFGVPAVSNFLMERNTFLTVSV